MNIPGWSVIHDDGCWTACCLAVIVYAASATELRTWIQEAITANDH